MNKNFILRGWRNWLCGIVALGLSACQTIEEQVGSQTSLKEGEISLQWIPANMGRVVTRAADVNKSSDETKITNVHIFLFNEDGNYLQPGNEGKDGFQGYKYLEGGRTNWILSSDMFDESDANDLQNVTVYVLANMPEGTFSPNINGQPEELDKEGMTPLAALEDLAIKLPEFTTEIPEAGLPMVVREDGVSLVDETTSQGKVITLQLRSMMARIDLNFTMNPLQPDENLPSLEFTEVFVNNFPTGGKIKSQLVSMTENEEETLPEETTEEGYGLQILTEIENAPLKGRTLREGNNLEMTLYMFEHARKAKELTYPEGMADSLQQRYKNDRAAEDAAYIEFEGTYTTQNGLQYHVVYTLYVGGNPYDDFTIKPNCHYENNIMVRGIMANDRGDGADTEALLDTRVNVHNDPVFIEMLRERMFDAHFNVTPMDVYIWDFDAAQSVTVTILDAEKNNWIRMEPYSVAVNGESNKYIWNKENPYENGTAPTGGYAARFAGDGKRKYFTTDLLNELNRQKGCTTYTVTKAEERIYFYMDENVPTKWQYERHENVPEREVTVQITYTPKGGDPVVSYATFTQAGMKIVRFNKYSRGGEFERVNRKEYWFYIEEYEEYLAHYDGKNEYTDTYDGMKWGLNGLRSDLGVTGEFYQYMSWGWENTKQIMEKYRGDNSWRGHEMTLNELPSGAAEYCYNKNKRSEDDSHEVAQVEWYLPTISEIEFAIDRYYSDYPDFRGNFYWSSNPGAEGEWNSQEQVNTGDKGEDEERARATRALVNPDYDPNARPGTDESKQFIHAVSAANEKYPTYEQNGETKVGGNALRTEKFRVRTIYVPVWVQQEVRDNGGSWWQ